MIEQLARLLEHLDTIVDERRQAEIDELYRRTLTWRPVPRLPIVFSYPLPDDFPFPPFPHSQTFDDPEKMLHNELVHAWGTSIACRDRVGDDLPLTIRANFGTVIIASLFGGRVEQVEENPPWARPFESLDAFRAALERDPLDFTRGWCPRVEERYGFYRETLSAYPRLSGLIRLCLPDLQGPLDNVELLRGSDVFVDLYQAPDRTDEALERAALAQVGFARHLQPTVSDGDGRNPEICHQHGVALPGRILIRNDTPIMMSAEMYERQIAPHDERVLREMGGGGLHACGRFEHLCPPFLELESSTCIDFGQPEMNDIDAVYAMAASRKAPLIRIRVPERQLVDGSVMRRFPTGVVLTHQADSLDEAGRIMKAYRRSTEGA